MVAKHVHATVITRLHQYTRDPSLTKTEREDMERVLRECLPDRIAAYLFEDGLIRERAFDLDPLRGLIHSRMEELTGYVEQAFRQGWPSADGEVTRPEALRGHIQGMVHGLGDVISRLKRRLHWALDQIRRLDVLREKQGDLNAEDDALFRRCDRLVKRLKGTARRTRREAEGYDDVNTFSVLAAEGFLPGYGLEVGSVLGTAEIPFWRTGAMEFVLPRPPGMALREYVPGNLIYANGNRFVARRFHRDIDEQRAEMPVFEISTEHQAVKETRLGVPASALGATILQTIAVCDVDLVHQSHISDEEEVRFQMGVSVYGLERDQHNGGRAYTWGEQHLQHRRGVRLRLVNVGSTSAISRFERFGYPICTVCGQSISPLSSEMQHKHFQDSHEERCGRPVSPVGFYADVVADVLSLPACPDQKTAYSVLEALRFATTRVLDMHMEDLQILVIGHVNRDEVDGLLWDPMPGGSGLLDQLCERFEEIVRIALEVVQNCPAACETSCIDCLQTFRNSYYHKHLNRKLAEDRIKTWGSGLAFSHAIPARQPVKESAEAPQPVNEAERRLKYLLLAAGFEEGIRGHTIRLDRAIGTTTPDVFYRAPHHEDNEGVCIYLDGLSAELHGNPERAEKDRRIRDWLRNNGYEVIEIAANELDDPDAMTRHFRKLAGYLREDRLREALRQARDWFRRAGEEGARRVLGVLKRVQPKPEERYVGCVPLVPLTAAAGFFSEPQHLTSGDWEWDWVKVETHHRLRPGMFVMQVSGKSMEPAISDGAYCLFSAPVTGSRQGRTVIVQLLDSTDPDTGERYTIKRYESEKSASEDGTWRHLKIILKPNNPDFQPIILTCEDENSVTVIAEFLELLS